MNLRSTFLTIRKNGSFLIGGTAFQAAVAFFSNIVLVRHLSPEDFGGYALAITSTNLIFSVFSLRIGINIVSAKEESLTDSHKGLLFSALLIETVLAVILSLFVLFLFGYLNQFTLLLLATTSASHFFHNNVAFYERSMPYGRLTLVESCSHFTGHVAAVILVVAGIGELTLYLRDLIIILVYATLLWLLKGVAVYKFSWPSFQNWNQIVHSSKRIWFDQAIEQLFERLLILLAGLIGGESGAGYYFQAQRLAGIPHQLLSPVAYRYSLNIFREASTTGKEYSSLLSIIKILSIPLTAAAIVTYFLAEIFVVFLYGEEWLYTSTVLMYMAGGIVFMTLFHNLKAYSYTVYQSKYLPTARLFQYFGLLLPIGATYLISNVTITHLGLGYSLSYAFSFLTLLLIYIFKNNNVIQPS